MLGVRRSFGRLIGRAVQCSKKNGCKSANSDGFSILIPSPFVQPSRCRHLIRENHSSPYYEVGKAKGDILNLSEILFTEYRDYLIKCNEDQRVTAEQLADKVVVIYFGAASVMNRNNVISLIQVYNDLHPNNGFEVVFVDVSFSCVISPAHSIREEPQKHFEDTVYSIMPWTAIPLSDITSRKKLKQIFGLPEIIYGDHSFVIDSTGKILQHGNLYNFHKYGVLGYPFSDERISYLKSEDDQVARKPSLKGLLASPQRDYLISNKGDKVPIQTLEDKVVALYFYDERVTNKDITRQLKTVYEELAKNNKLFEVVLIYLYDTLNTNDRTEDSFSDTFKDMPWLALPFKDPSYKKLERFFFFPWYLDMQEFALLIIGPRMEFIEPFGLFILMNFKVPAFPFSRYRLAKLITEEAKELKLEMLWNPESVFGEKYGFQVQYSQFTGKRVIIIFESFFLHENEASFLETLKERYIKLKGTTDEFEVIHIVEEYFQDLSKKDQVENLPWFVLLAGEEGCEGNLFFHNNYCWYKTGGRSLLAFDRDGSVVRKTSDPSVEDLYFPFRAGSMETEALLDLIPVFGWDGFDCLPPPNRYSRRKGTAMPVGWL